MYESPINIMFQNIETQIVQRDEQMIFEAIQKQGVFIDKEELIKAINYDRNQYSKGYKDGYKDGGSDEVLNKIKRDIFSACSDNYHMPVYKLDCDEIFEIINKYTAEGSEAE